jgi:uncharacterized membrane protein (DUF485 family)
VSNQLAGTVLAVAAVVIFLAFTAGWLATGKRTYPIVGVLLAVTLLVAAIVLHAHHVIRK